MFDGKLTTDQVITMTQCMQARAEAPNVIVTTTKLAVGVNIYPRCFVLFLEEPACLADFYQGLGRANRPAGGPIYVAFPKAPGAKFDPEVLLRIL